MRRSVPVALAIAVTGFDPRVPAGLAKGGAVLFVAMAVAAWRWRTWHWSEAALRLAGLAAWLGLSLAWSPHPDPLVVAPWVSMALLGLAVASDPEPDRRDRARTYALAVVAVTGTIAAWQRARGAGVDGGHGQGNALGLVTAACLPLVLERLSQEVRAAVAVGRARLAHDAVSVGVLLLGLHSIASSQSRTAWAATAIAGAFVARGAWRLVALPLVVALGYASGGGHLHAALEGRVWIAKVNATAALEAAPLGAGAGGHPFAFLRAQGDRLASMDPVEAARTFLNATTPHGDWLGLAVTGGVVGVALALWAATAWWRSRREWPAGSAVALIVALGAFGDDTVALPAAAVALVLVAPTSDERRMAGRLRANLLALGFVLGGALLLPVVVRRVAAQHMLRAAERLDSDEGGHRRLLDRARAMDPTDGEVALASGLARLSEGDAEHALEELLASEPRLANVGTPIAIGNAEMLRGRHERAIRAYRRALALDPGSFRARANLVEALRRTGDLDAAAEALAVARRLQPHHPKLLRMADELDRARVDAASREKAPDAQR